MVTGVKMLLDKYGEVTLQRVWESLFTRFNQVLRAFGLNDSDVQHSGVQERQIIDCL